MALKINIIKILFLMIVCFFPISSYAADVSEDIRALSALQFWNKINNLNIQDTEKEYIICGKDVCDSEIDRCVVKITEREGLGSYVQTSWWTNGILSTIVKGAKGEIIIKKYKYKCIGKTDKLGKGWEEAPIGGTVKKERYRTGGWLAKAKSTTESCYSAQDGKKYCLLTKDKEGKDQKATVVYNTKGTAFNGCEVLPVKLYNNRRCFFCSLFTISVKVANDMTAKSFKAFASAFAAVIVVGLAIWIAIQVLLQVSSVTKQDAPKFLTNLLKQCYKFVIAFLLLQNSSYIFEKVISPLIVAGIEFGTTMVGEEQFSFNTQTEGQDSITPMEEENPGITARANSIGSNEGEEEYFSSELYTQLDNFIARLQRKLSFMQSVGSSLICIGNNAMRLFKGTTDLKFGDGFQLFIEGGLLAGFGFLMALAFAFYMVDAIVQLAVVGALMPFLIASWPFKLTSKYAQTGWSIFLNSVFLLMFSGLIINVGYNLIDKGIGYTSENAQSSTVYNAEEKQKDMDQTSAKQEVEMGALYEIAQIINRQNEKDLQNVTDISSVGFLILLFCCIFAMKLIKLLRELASKFAAGALSPVAPEIATMGASAVKSLALNSTKAVREGIDNKFKSATRSVIGFGVGAIVHPHQTIKRVVSGVKNFAQNTKELASDIKYKTKDIGSSIKNKIGKRKRSGN